MSELYEHKSCLTAKTNAKAFAEALKKAGMVLGKSCIPVLEEILVRFSNGKCILTGTNLETYLIAEISAEGDDFAFVFARTKDVERACRYYDGELTFELTETGNKNRWFMVRLSCGPRVAEFDAYPAEDYPVLPSVEGPILFSANAADLLERINRVSYAAMKPGYSSREASCCVEFVESQIYAVDGVRAAWDTDPALTFPQPFLIHAAPLSYLKVFGGQTVNFQLSGHNLRASANGMAAFFRVSETVPFKLMDTVPPRYVEEFLISPKNILDELAYLKNVTPPTNKPYVYLAGNELSMRVNGKKYSTAVNIERTGDLPVGFNLHHITDAFKQFGKEKQVRVKLSGINMPIVIEAEGRSDCAMLLPVRVDQNAAA